MHTRDISLSRSPFYLFFTGILLAAIFSTGCSSPLAQPTPTPTPEPSNTPLPTDTPTPAPTHTPTLTDTPEPTSTPTLTNTPTETPDLTATVAAEVSATASALLAEFDAELQAIGYSTETGQLGWSSMDDYLIMELDTYNTHKWMPLGTEIAFLPMGSIGRYSDFILKADVTWESTSGLAICGFWIRGESQDRDAVHYKFQTLRLSGYTSWNVEYWKFNRRQSTVLPYTRTSHIYQDNGSTNTYIIVVEGDWLTAFANGERLGRVMLNQLEEGISTAYIRQESGETMCRFENIWIWELAGG